KTVIKAKPHKECKTLGCVGEIKKINLDLIRKSARPKTIPVISPVGIGPHKQFHNVNADDVSSEISISLKAAKLVLLTDVRGIMREKGNVETLIPTIKMEETEALITDNVIQAGMIPKVRSCTNALKGGVQKTHIVDGKIPHSLLLEIFTDTGIGTEIIKG
ncbi:MAG: acetylglutamate kinase, partial [Candidatus Omnitrophota bacterium]|nr:acetylglutamate kinase [Candidatus Omnitrophota bacterium]